MDDKELIKEALREWLDEKFAEFGRWTAKSLAAIIFSLLVYAAVKYGIIK